MQIGAAESGAIGAEVVRLVRLVKDRRIVLRPPVLYCTGKSPPGGSGSTDVFQGQLARYSFPNPGGGLENYTGAADLGKPGPKAPGEIFLA